REYDVKLVAAHVNHGWRPEADADARFCQDVAHTLGIGYEQAHLHELMGKKFNGSHEEMARHARRSFFMHCAQNYQADRIALAHHADDQQETFFIRMLRGATLTGLASMRSRHDMYVRPLLHTYKEDMLAYLHAHSISYCHDATNADTRYLRNRIRHTVVPVLKACDE